MRYSEICERNLINGADSANCLRTVQVCSSRQTPTTERGSLDEKLSRGELLSASRMDIGFISDSENSHLAAVDCRCYRARGQVFLLASLCRKPERSRT